MIIASLALVAVALSACAPSYTFKYKLTVSIERDGVVHTGSSVVRFWDNDNPIGAIDGSDRDSGAAGDAVYVDLGGGRMVVALIGKIDPMLFPGAEPSHWGSAPEGALCRIYGLPPPLWRDGRNPCLAELARGVGEAPLSREDYPDFVTFDDPTRPQTARLVSPDNMASVLGGDAHIVSVTLGLTDDRVTHDIVRRLPWLIGLGFGSLSGHRFIKLQGASLADVLDSSYFTR